ncbi:MAG: GNAT family N-acetyltransferase [Lachnospiraceae bacterium]
MNEQNFRRAELSELEQVIDVYEKTIQRMHKLQLFQWDEEYPNAAVLKADIEQQQLYINKRGNKIASCYVRNQESDQQYENGAWKNPKASYCVIHRFCVNPEFQNQGIGNETMEQIEQQMIAEGIEAIRLDTFTENSYAVKLYEKRGYLKVGMANWQKGSFYLMEKYLIKEKQGGTYQGEHGKANERRTEE